MSQRLITCDSHLMKATFNELSLNLSAENNLLVVQGHLFVSCTQYVCLGCLQIVYVPLLLICRDWGDPKDMRAYMRASLFCHVQLCDSMDCSLPGSAVYGIFQARILEWVAISSSRIFPTQGSYRCLLHLLHWQIGSLPLRHLRKPALRTGAPQWVTALAEDLH